MTTYQETELNEALLKELIALSRNWEAEDSCWGYRANSREDLEGRRIFLAREDGQTIGYLFGKPDRLNQKRASMPANAKLFEVEELYVIPSCRSQGIGKALFQYAEEKLKPDAEYIVLSTATKNWKAILHFYLEQLDLQFWSATLFRKI
jgi:GNAT superfamily N-acetyltransferase